FIQIKNICRLSTAKDKDFVPLQIESDESRLTLDYEIGLRVSCDQVVQSDFPRKIFYCDLISRWVYGGLSSAKTVSQVTTFDRINKHSIFRVKQHQPITFRHPSADIKGAFTGFHEYRAHSFLSERIHYLNQVIIRLVAQCPRLCLQLGRFFQLRFAGFGA